MAVPLFPGRRIAIPVTILVCTERLLFLYISWCLLQKLADAPSVANKPEIPIIWRWLGSGRSGLFLPALFKDLIF